jgi:hypothetical protein
MDQPVGFVKFVVINLVWVRTPESCTHKETTAELSRLCKSDHTAL